jgi:hypothetical protein
MSQFLQPTTTPATAADATAAWIEQRREIMFRDGLTVRAGAGLWIECQSSPNRPEEYLPINTPTGGQLYATAADRDAVLRRLWGHAE